jgi:hypothetical protein
VVGDVVVVVVVVVVVELDVDPGVVVEVDVGDVVVVVVIVIAPPQLDDKRVTDVAGSESGGVACAATSASVSGTEAGVDTVSVVPSTNDTVMTQVDAEDAVVDVPAVSVSADATGTARNPSPRSNTPRPTSAARRRLPPVIVFVGSCASASAIPERGDPPRSHPGPGNYLSLRRFATWNRIPGDCSVCCPGVIVRAAPAGIHLRQRSEIRHRRST